METMTPAERKNIYGQLTELRQDLARVLFILESDQNTNSKGLVETVRNIHNDVEQIKILNKVNKARVASYGIVGGAVFGAFVWLLKEIFTKKIF